MEAKCWGVEHLSPEERVKKALDAGVDQFGGEACPEIIVGLVRSGQVPEARLDQSVRRLLQDKFRLGLFDHPFVDPQAAVQVVGNPAFQAKGELAQRKSIVLLKNGATGKGKVLPVQGQPRIYVEGIQPELAADMAGWSIPSTKPSWPSFASAPLINLGKASCKVFSTPATWISKARRKNVFWVCWNRLPTIVDIYLDRPAVIPEIAEKSAGLLADFGASDAAVLDVIFGRFNPTGKLPFELPSSMEAVKKQKEDLPYDSQDPLFPFGYGLTY